MVPLETLAQITQRFEFLEAKMSSGVAHGEIAVLSREYSELRPVVTQIAAYRRALDDLAEAEAMLSDPEMKALAEEEIPTLRDRIPEMEQALRLALLMPAPPFLRFGPAPVARRQPFSRVTCCGCISVTAKPRAGALKSSRCRKAILAGCANWSPISRARGFLRN